MATYDGGSVEVKITSTADQAKTALTNLASAVKNVRLELFGFNSTFKEIAASVNKLGNGLKVIERLNIGKVNAQIAEVGNSLRLMSDELAKKPLSGFDTQANEAITGLNRLTNAFAKLDKLNDLDTRRIYEDLDRLGRISSVGIQNLADRLKDVDTSKIQSVSSTINSLANGLIKIQGLKLDPSITGNLQSQFELLAPTVNGFIRQIADISIETRKSVKEIAGLIRALNQLPKSMQAMQALDLSKIGNVFSELATQIQPFLATLREASAELTAFATIVSKMPRLDLGTGISAITAPKIGGTNIFQMLVSGASGAFSWIKRIVSQLGILDRQAKKTGRSMSGVFQASRFIFLLYAMRRIGQAVGSVLKLSIDFVEIENLFSRSMGNMRDEAMRFQQTMAQTFGLAMPDMMKAQALFNNIVKQLGGLNEQVTMKVSEALVKMSLDFAALYNVGIEDAFEKFQAALVGQVKPIRGVSGMDITFATMQTYLDQAGIDRTVRSLSEVEKRILRIHVLQKQLAASGAMGAFAQEIENPANQLKVLEQQLQEVGRWISAVFMGTIGAVLPYINAFVMALKEMVQALAYLVGFVDPKTEGLSDMFETADATDGLDNMAGAAGGAADAMKELKNASTGIDELNVIMEQTAAGGAAGGVGDLGLDPNILGLLSDYENFMDGVRMKADEMKDAILEFFKKLGDIELDRAYFTNLGKQLADWINSGIQTMLDWDWDIIRQHARNIAEALALMLGEAVENLNWAGIGQILGHGFNTALDFINTFLKTFPWVSLGRGFAIGLNNLISTIDWDLLGRTIANKFNAIIKTLFGVVTTFDWKNLGLSISAAINGFFDEIDWRRAGKTLSDGIKGVLDLIITVIQETDWYAIGNSIAKFFEMIDWLGIIARLAELIGSALGGLLLLLAGAIENVVYEIGQFFSKQIEIAGGDIIAGLFTGIIVGMANIVTWIIDNIFKPFIDGIKKVFKIQSPSKVMEELGVFVIEGFFIGVKSITNNIINFFNDLLKNIQDIFKDIGTWFSDRWTDITKAFSTTVQWFKDTFNNAWNGITEIWKVVSTWFKDNVWNKIVEIFQDIPTWFSTKFTEAWTAIKKVFEPVKAFFDGIWTTIKNVFTSIGDTVGIALSNAFAAVVNSIIGFAESKINDFIYSINKAINVINNIPGVHIDYMTYLKAPRLQYMEQGGFPDKGMFVMNEGRTAEMLGSINGQTAVVNNDQIVASVSGGVSEGVASVLVPMVRDIIAAIYESGGGDVIIGDETITRANRRGERKLGVSQITGAFANA